MNLPSCPNFREKGCERSDLRLVNETEQVWCFLCNTCGLIWMVSKPRTKEAARYHNQLDRIQKATDEERARARRTKYFVMSGGR